MAAWVCLSCSAVYSVDAAACPQCGSTDWRGDWEPAHAATQPTGGQESGKETPPTETPAEAPDGATETEQAPVQ